MATDPEKLKLAAQLAAIEYLLTRLFAAFLKGAPDHLFDQMIQNYRTGLEDLTIPGLDAALSDLTASEVRDEVLRLLNAIREIRTKGL